MFQQIITYLIVAIAVTVALTKIVKRFRKKKTAKVNFQKERFSMEHNCTACSADCTLRNQPQSIIEENKEVCSTNKIDIIEK